MKLPPMTKIQRLHIVADWVEHIHQRDQARDVLLTNRQWNFGAWGTLWSKRQGCGTVACAAGWTKVLWPQMSPMMIDGDDEFGEGWGLYANESRLADFFGLDYPTTMRLFYTACVNGNAYNGQCDVCPGDCDCLDGDATGQEWADKCRQFLAERNVDHPLGGNIFEQHARAFWDRDRRAMRDRGRGHSDDLRGQETPAHCLGPGQLGGAVQKGT